MEDKEDDPYLNRGSYPTETDPYRLITPKKLKPSMLLLSENGIHTSMPDLHYGQIAPDSQLYHLTGLKDAEQVAVSMSDK